MVACFFVRIQHVLLGFVAVGFSIRCTPEFGDLQGGVGGRGGNSTSGTGGDGGDETQGGTAGTGGTPIGGAPNRAGNGGVGGDGGAGAAGAAGEGGLAPGGSGGAGGEAGLGGEGGIGGPGTSGVGGTGGEPSLVIPCEDGCAHLYVPFSSEQASSEQMFVILLPGAHDLTAGKITVRLRLVGSSGASEIVQLFCNDTGYQYFGGAPTSLASFTSEEGGTLSIFPVTGTDPTGAEFNAAEVGSIGVQVKTTSADPQPVHVIVEEFSITGSTPEVGPWKFTESAAPMIPNTQYMPVLGSTVTWAPPYP